MQGRKGIGRYAANILGQILELETIDKKGNKSYVKLNCQEFENSEYLDNVGIDIISESTSMSSGTKLKITGNHEELLSWDKKQVDKLVFELKKLLPPSIENIKKNDFEIFIYYKNFPYNNSLNSPGKIEPYPILDLYHYRIAGKISKNGAGEFIYSNKRIRNVIEEKIIIDKYIPNTNCGNLRFDIRVYDRDSEAIDELIAKGLKDQTADRYLGKLETKQLLNTLNGIGVYRNGFRIRPLGDTDFDWLKLNAQRVQNPSLKIGSNQVIGYVYIESEEESNLVETSARDGLKNNLSYEALKRITQDVLSQLEERRFIFRRENEKIK